MTRAQRNKNPVNLKYARQREAIGADDAGFAVFPTVEAGWRGALRQILLDAQRGLTVGEYIYKFAPPYENDTETYLAFVLRRVSSAGRVITRDTKLSDLGPYTLMFILEAQARMEGFYA